jgi:putative membrane protein
MIKTSLLSMKGFNKSKTIIQLNKIQQVNINQSLLQRIVGVYELDVDTGSSKKRREDKSNFTSISFSIEGSLNKRKE